MGIHPDHGSISESERNYYTDFAGAPELDGGHPNPLQSNPPPPPTAETPKAQPSSQGEYPPEKTQLPEDGGASSSPVAASTAHPTGTQALDAAAMPPAFSHEHPQALPSPAGDSKEAEARPRTPGTPFLYFEPPPTYAESNHGSTHGALVDEKPPLPPRRATPSSSSSSGKVGLGDRLLSSVAGLASKASGPVNRLTNRLGSEAFWPSSLDKECDKAARILTSFCTGFYSGPTNQLPPSGAGTPSRPSTPNEKSSPNSRSSSNSPRVQQQQQQQQSKVFVQIPRTAIATAQGLAIFTTLRGGFHLSGAAGSGLVVARLPDGTWSPPSAFSVTALGAGIVAGIDIQDCVCVLHTREAVEAFTRPRWSLGAEVGVTAGPVGGAVGGAAALRQGSRKKGGRRGGDDDDDDDVGSVGDSRQQQQQQKQKHGFEPIWTYAKSRGLYVGMQADGTVIVQRPDANAAFYGERGISAERILRAQVPQVDGSGRRDKDGNLMWPEGTRRLVEALKMAEGSAADESVIREIMHAGPTPGDLGTGAVPAPGGKDTGVAWVDDGGKGEKGGAKRDSLLYK
ncbi:hypothetical protein MGN70_002538 [Eutypa lata]|nr:hypothetical protein MGN70_002538 [Eutypa lata]